MFYVFFSLKYSFQRKEIPELLVSGYPFVMECSIAHYLLVLYTNLVLVIYCHYLDDLTFSFLRKLGS